MMESLIIKNAKAVLTDRIVQANVLIKNGKIEKIGAENCSDLKEIDAKGGYLFPGFIDVHIHGGGGADFMDATPQAFETAIRAHLLRGTTALVPTAMTAKREELKAFIKAYLEFKNSSTLSDLALGLHLEGPYFSKSDSKSKGAQSGELIRDIDFDEIDEILKLARGNIIRWDAAPEIKNSEKFAKIMKDNNVICAVAHTDATASEAQAGFKAGFSHVTHFYNAVTAYKKREQTVTAGVVEAAYLDDNITVELICDGKHIPKQCMQLALKIKGADRVLGITDAMRISCTDMLCGKLGSIQNGTEVIIGDGVAKLPDLSSYAGSICTMDRALKVVCTDFGIDPITAAKMLSTNPARHINAKNIGEIKEGYNADLVICDAEFNLKHVIKNGEQIT